MSNIYIQEPPSNGKVLLKTTVGDIDVELWSKEAPKACRNFVQLCMEGYYDGTSFHRVVKDFIVQGGDPTDSGEGGESIYGAPFKDEFHTRLRFVRRGLVAMANSGPHDNGSQFFFTMAATPELQNKHTIFGKVVGDTLYNMLKLQEVEVDEASERPAEPHKILSTEVLNNPFDDIVPRQLKRQKKDKDDEKKVKSKSKATKNFSLLSFGDEAEDDEEQVDKATESFRGKSKSSHDLTDDPRLSSVPAVDKDRAKTAEEEKRKKNTEDSPDEGRAKREEKKTEEEEEEPVDKTESPKDESVKKNSSSPRENDKRKSDSPEETKKPKAESKPEGKRKSRFEPLESEKKKSPEPVKASSSPEDSDTKRKIKTEVEGDGKKNVKDEVKEESRKKKQESEPQQESKKRKGDEPHKEEKKKRSKDTEDEERRKRKGDSKDEEGRKKRKGEEVKEEGKKKAKTEAVSSPRPTEDEKNTKDDVRQKLKKEKEKEESPRGKESKSLLAFVEEEKQNRMDEIKKEQRRLQRDIKDSKKRTTADDKVKVKTEDEDEVDEKKDGNTEENDLLALVKKERMKYKQRKKQMGKKEDREAATLAMLSRFQSKLSTARTLAGDYDDMEEEKAVDEETEDPDDISWLRHKLHFEDSAQKTKVIDANISDNDRYTLIDPRNPLNQRRRETSKRAMRDKR